MAFRNGRPRGDLPRCCAGRHPGQFGGRDNQGTPIETGRVLNSADRSAALIVIKVEPVAGVGTFERDHAGAVLAGGLATDVGEPPFGPALAPIREQARYPGLGSLAQALCDPVGMAFDVRSQRLRPSRVDRGGGGS